MVLTAGITAESIILKPSILNCLENIFMGNLKWLVILAFLLYITGEAAAQQAREKALQEIAAAENAFADYAAANGARDAFLTCATANTVVFAPQPANAKEV